MQITDNDRARIAEAISTAEQQTSGEIFCVVSRRVSAYVDVSLAWAAAMALLTPIVFIPFVLDFRWPGDRWEAAHQAAQAATTGQALALYALSQAMVFIGVFLFTRISAVRRLATPPAIRRARVREAALQQFLAQGVHVTDQRTGVLIFAALDEQQVELIADEGIYTKVDEEAWAQAVAVLTRELRADRPVEGFAAAIALCGEVLARHFPPRPNNPNELPDHLILL
ncbi:TPM domain-containing protein [Brevundimonas sp.]|uniref:TPM domain-containing protein n=1 Tax=Brevundimonas sp. TaxID=1871086 RepID=UPI00356692D6